jgi:thiol-disulfide isomerase/thioredoxin
MTTGGWILLASVLLAVGFGLYRAYADGRFRGTHEVRLAGQGVSRLVETGVEEGAQPPPRDLASGPPAAPVEQPLVPGDQLGERATLLQFSSAFCAPCRATRRVLSDVATAVPGVRHVELDAEQHLDLVRRVGVTRTPTTLVLDGAGREVTRAAGAPRKEQVLGALAGIDA